MSENSLLEQEQRCQPTAMSADKSKEVAMDFTCPHCGHNSFKIEREVEESQLATCSKCGKSTPFEQEQMKTPHMKPNASRKLHLK
jgi:transcription elongation factor Elf1